MILRKLANKSSWITKVEYDPRAKVMQLSTKAGKMYPYQGVPAKLVDEFCAADSPGEFFNERVVGKFELARQKGGKGGASR
ncbi:MAG TPA: KTSC domain-containing protein [Candidatus Acidoferrum sp.]|nr:KTSC domain-containing protein [Candidatus Acidoferrum sp.]